MSKLSTGLLIAAIPAVFAGSYFGNYFGSQKVTPQEPIPQVITYTQEQLDEVKGKAGKTAVDLYIVNQEKETEKTLSETNKTDIGGLRTDMGILETTVNQNSEKVPGQVEEALKDYFGEQDTRWYNPNTGQWFNPNTGQPQTTNYRGAYSVSDIVLAKRLSIPGDVAMNMENWSSWKFDTGFSFVNDWQLENGNISSIHIDELARYGPKSKVHFTNGNVSGPHSINLGKVEDLLQQYFSSYNGKYDIGRVTIQTAGQ